MTSIPTLRCEYAPGFSPLNLPSSGDWVTLSSNIKSFASSRGQQDALSVFEPGQATIVLDGSNDDLDPLVAGSLLYGSDGIPGTPVRLIATDGATTSTRFTGFMWPDGPTPTSPRKSRSMEVTIVALDFIGWAASRPMPDCEWSAWVAANDPEIWLRGQANFDGVLDPSLPSAYEVFNFGSGSQTGGHTGTNDAHATSSIISGTSDPGLYVENGGRIVMSAATAFSPLGWTIAGGFQQVAAGGGSTTLVECNGAHVQWRIYYDNTGKVFAQYYNSSGTLLAAAQTAFGNVGDGNPHWFIAKYTIGGGVSLWTDASLIAATATTSAASMAGSTGTLTVMQTASGSSNCVVQGVAYMPSTAVNPSGDGITVHGTTGTTTVGGLRSGDTASNRFADTCDIAAILTPPTLTATVTAAWTFGGFRAFGSFGDALQRIGTSMGGATWVQRDGTVRVRDFQALADATYAAQYATEQGVLTDDPAAGGSPIRYSNPTRTGARTDRVINTVTVADQASPYVAGGGAAHFNVTGATSLNMTSVNAYGPRPTSVDSDTTNLDLLKAYTDATVSTYANPVTEPRAITVDPLVDANARTWVLSKLELETAVHYREATATNTHTPIDGTYRVMHIDESWQNGLDWSVTVTLKPV